MPIRLWLYLCLIGMSLFSSAAMCHTRLVSSQPARDQVLTRSPSHLTLTFSTPIEATFSRVALSKMGEEASVSATQALKVRVEGRTMHCDLPALAPARYRVSWRVLARDGHAQRGQFSFELR